jgi:hypothetical protein
MELIIRISFSSNPLVRMIKTKYKIKNRIELNKIEIELSGIRLFSTNKIIRGIKEIINIDIIFFLKGIIFVCFLA